MTELIALTSQEFITYSATVGTLIVLEGLLSADNALVLAVMVRNLPKEQQAQALRYGIWGAFFFRAVGIVLASQLVKIWYLKALGALYLLYLCLIHFWRKWRAGRNLVEGVVVVPPQAGFWRTVAAVELTDIAFSLDSIMAAVALSDNIYIIYIGGILGIITMRFVANWFIRLLDVYTMLETSAYLLVGWIAIKLGAEIIDKRYIQPEGFTGHGGMPGWLFWSVMLVVFVGGFFVKKKESPAAAIDAEKSAPENH